MTFNCPWCGNTWTQKEEEPHKCKVCQHYPWEGTPEIHMRFEDITAWEKYNSSQEKEQESSETAFDKLKKAFPDYF